MRDIKNSVQQDIADMKRKIEQRNLKKYGERRHAPRHNGAVVERLTIFEIICSWFK